jgi:CheY-like chemotaxis protein
LLTIITDILDISKIEAGLLPIYEQKFNINEMLDELLAQFEIEKKQKFKDEIELKIQKGFENNEAEIFSDRARIYQVVSNLIGNAIKFTEKGAIEFGYKVINKEKLIFFVKDTGIGINRDKQAIIFERFRQVDDSTNRKYGGTGLGLAICKGLVSLLGGKIWVESNPGNGSVFYFSLNYKPITALIHPKLQETVNEVSIYSFYGKSILIVEDVEDNFLLLKEILDETNANLLRASNGKEAIKIARQNKSLNLILVDIQLPDINGYKVTKQIKSFYPKLKIIAQTAYGLSGDREKALDAGFDDYISKPIIRKTFLDLINKYV